MADLLDSATHPGIYALRAHIDEYLRNTYPDFFGEASTHPCLPIKRSKVIHDNLWGTNRFTWRELALIDSPLLQRLRYIHQTGLASQIYPSAQHSRFEHSLGVTAVASKILDSLLQNDGGRIRTIIKALPLTDGAKWSLKAVNNKIAQLRTELRMAALLHDTGHSLFSHSSEKVFEQLSIVKEASREISEFVGKDKGAGESIAFAIAISESVQKLIARARTKLLSSPSADEYKGSVDLLNVALLIIGRSNHPHLQFLGDIVSSGFDADKLDYLLRDARAAGLPLRYDIERYFFAVRLEQNEIADGEGKLARLYSKVARAPIEPETRLTSNVTSEYQSPLFYSAYRLRLPSSAINTIEQLVICKLMLYSYIYHHPKVRAAEGELIKLLHFVVAKWTSNGKSDKWILSKFLDMTDATLNEPFHLIDGLDAASKQFVQTALYRLRNRLLPREVYRIGGAVAEAADRKLLRDYMVSLQDEKIGPEFKRKLERRIGKYLLEDGLVEAADPEEALRITGARVDIPRAPKFDEVTDLVVKGTDKSENFQLLQLFPIEHWTDAYSHYRTYVRIYCYSEYLREVDEAGQSAMKEVIGIHSDAFYNDIRRKRG